MREGIPGSRMEFRGPAEGGTRTGTVGMNWRSGRGQTLFEAPRSRWEMKFLAREPRLERHDGLSLAEERCGPQRWLNESGVRARQIDESAHHIQHMRRVGLALCVVSAAITIASATWIVGGF